MEEKILLVDDDKELLALMELILADIGITTITALGGARAVEILKKNSFSIVISDIEMPVFNGRELLQYIKAHFPATDVILITGFSEKYSITDIINEGATDFIEKPLNKDVVRAKITRIYKERIEISRRKRAEKKLLETTKELRLSHQELERKVLERTKELHDAQTELISVFKSVPDGIITVDTTMVVLHKNDQYMGNLTVEQDQVFQPGTSKFQLECHRILANTLKNQAPVNDYRLEFNKGEGNHQAFLVSTSVLTGKNGDSKGALLVIHDISQVAVLENKLHERRSFHHMVGESQKMQEIYQLVRQVASVDTTILITGDSGVGKELLIDTLHTRGDRASKPIIKVNCSALPENLLESELFGHVKGAFTGASKDRIGRVQMAEGGILFLDEIGDISPRIQLQLLRFLEMKEYEKVGESQKRKADVRIFAATNANLSEKVKDGSFRKDLFYRLKVMEIHVPPLSQRQEDIPLFIEHFIALFNKKFNKQVSGVSDETLALFINHEWSGNVRELNHAIEHAFLLCQGDTLELEHFPKEMFSKQHVQAPHSLQASRTLTRESLLSTLNSTQWHRTKTAKILKISRATLYNKLKEFGLSPQSP